MKTFDIKEFNKNKVIDTYKYKINDTVIVEEKIYLKKFFIQKIRNFNDYFEDVNVFHSNGNLKIQGRSFIKKFDIGIWKIYDEKGSLIKEIDYDKPYEYSWDKVSLYLKKHNVKDFEKDIINIDRNEFKDSSTWTLEFNGIYNDVQGRYVITLNGKTGEELEVKLFKGKKALGKTGTIADYKIILKR